MNKPLQTIFDKSFSEGKIPSTCIWKDANITALYKNKGDKSQTTNYRPVSLTCLPSRICERSVRDASIMNHMYANNFFLIVSMGFVVKLHSTTAGCFGRLGVNFTMIANKLTLYTWTLRKPSTPYPIKDCY